MLSALRGMGVEGAHPEHVVEGKVQEAKGCELGEAGGTSSRVFSERFSAVSPVRRSSAGSCMPCARAGSVSGMPCTAPGPASARKSRGLLLG